MIHQSRPDLNARALPGTVTLSYTPEDPRSTESRVLLSRYAAAIKRHLAWAAIFVSSCVAATVLVSLRLQPTYESTVTIDVDCQRPTGIFGQDAARSTLAETEPFLSTQVKLIQSDSVVRPVALRYGLPQLEAPANNQPRETEPDTPVMLKNLKVTRPPNTYLILISYRSADPVLSAKVANGIATSYIDHMFEIRHSSSAAVASFMSRELEDLKAKMERSTNQLLAFERELNVINPEQKTSIVSSRLMQLNAEYSSSQADRVRKEAAYRSVSSGTLEAAQVSSQAESLRKLTEHLDEVQQKFADVRSRFGTNHPEYIKAQSQVNEATRMLQERRQNIEKRVAVEYHEAASRELMLQKAVAEQKAEFDRLNARSFEYQGIKQSAEADRRLYEELVRKVKEATINAGFRNTSIRVADPARPPERPVSPNITLNAFVAFLLSSFLAVGAAVISDAVDDKVRGPGQISGSLDTDIIGILPKIGKRSSNVGPGGELVPLRAGIRGCPTSMFEEAVRALRIAILRSNSGFPSRPRPATLSGGSRSLLITSASQEEGKSTIAAHLSLAHARQGLRTLLIDGSLRRPAIHQMFGIDCGPGLSEVVTQQKLWQDTVVTLDGVPELSILPAGRFSPWVSDKLGRGLVQILVEASEQYDLVILDSPPLAANSDGIQMAALVDGVVVVARADQARTQELYSVLQLLRRVQANTLGIVLNGLQQFSPTTGNHLSKPKELPARKARALPSFGSQPDSEVVG
jgi:succinoglycan biosynthesis transport protein ExoP